MGAIASGGVRYLERGRRRPRLLGIDRATIDEVSGAEAEVLAWRERAYRGGRPPVETRGRTVILVDDGLATGSSMRAAVLAVGQTGPAAVVVAVPVAAASTCREFERLVDRVVCAFTPEPFRTARGTLVRGFLPDDGRGGPRPARRGLGTDGRVEQRTLASMPVS